MEEVKKDAVVEQEVNKNEVLLGTDAEDTEDNGHESEEKNELTDEQREAIIDDWNSVNKDKGYIRNEKVTEEELKEIVEEYKNELDKYNSHQFELADAHNSVRVAEFLKKWNEDDVQWENNLWMGTVMFDAIVKEFLESSKQEAKPFLVNYGTLTYLFLTLRNFKGRGLKSAIHMQKINEEYSKILDTVGDLYTEYQEWANKLQLMQERWRFAEMGFYVVYNELEDKCESTDSSTEDACCECDDCSGECESSDCCGCECKDEAQ